MPADLVVAARLPFGRYAATPWFRSRREHVGNVEWPPSPWRIARALVAAAHRAGGDDVVDAAVALVRRLAKVNPRYHLPPSSEVVYAQWMPQLEFDDSPGASARSENGHTLLALSTDRELHVKWPNVELSRDERELLGRLLERTPYLGQSVSVCSLELREVWPERLADETAAVPREAADEELGLSDAEREIVRLLAPEPDVKRGALEVSTADGLVKAMAAPAGARWVDYVRDIPRRRQPRREAELSAIVHRLEGPLRPAMASPYHPHAGRRTAVRPLPPLETLVRRACGWLPDHATVHPADDDLDGRAERIVIRLATPLRADAARRLLAPPSRLAGPGIDCALRLEHVEPAQRAPSHDRHAGGRLLLFELRSQARPLLADAIVVCETFRRRMLGVAGRRLGADAIPGLLSGRGPDGKHLEDDHDHVHFLVASGDRREIDTFAVWCPVDLHADEEEVVQATTLPPLLGARIDLAATAHDPFTGPARRFRSHTPFLPVQHPRRRGGVVRNPPVDQVRQELQRRSLPDPIAVRPLPGPWNAFRIVRQTRSGAFAHLGAFGFELEFAEPVWGPIALGRNSHFGLGLFLPANE